MKRDRISLAGRQTSHPPRTGRRFASPLKNSDDGSDFDGTDFDDDSELDPVGEPWDPLVLEDDDEEPEPEYGDFWPEPDNFDD